MSDKENKLNNNDDNIQFDKLTNEDQPVSDHPSVNKGTAPLKRLTPRDPQIVALSKRVEESSENTPRSNLPVTGKLPSLPDDEPLDTQAITEDELSSKPSDESETDTSAEQAKLTENKSENDTETDKPIASDSVVVDATPLNSEIPAKSDPTPLNRKLVDEANLIKPLPTPVSSDEAKDSPPDLVEANIDDTPKSSDTPDQTIDIASQTTDEAEAEKPATHVRRSKLDILQDRASFLTFNKKKTEKPPEKNPDTAILPDQSPSWKKVIDGQAQGTTGTIGDQREVLFVIRGMIERVVMKDNARATLGRFETGTVPNEEIDLIPYGAIDRGVSRRHCEILLRDNHLHVVDLGSTNGTFLAGIRLKPNEATLLRKGDELLLGRLAVQVLFR